MAPLVPTPFVPQTGFCMHNICMSQHAYNTTHSATCSVSHPVLPSPLMVPLNSALLCAGHTLPCSCFPPLALALLCLPLSSLVSCFPASHLFALAASLPSRAAPPPPFFAPPLRAMQPNRLAGAQTQRGQPPAAPCVGPPAIVTMQPN